MIPMTVLITTANNPPAGMPFLKMTDPVLRRITAKAALYFWVAQGIQQIVLADATGTNLLTDAEWKEIDDTETSVEQISYVQANESVIEHGKGYGEGKLIEYAINNSSLLNRIDGFLKCTGKVYIRNFPEIAEVIRKYNVSNLFWRHMENDGTYLRPWADCRFYYTSKSFAKQHLIPAYLASDDKVAACENCIYEALDHNLAISRTIRPFIAGYCGGFGGTYLDTSLGLLDRSYPCWIAQT